MSKCPFKPTLTRSPQRSMIEFKDINQSVMRLSNNESRLRRNELSLEASEIR